MNNKEPVQFPRSAIQLAGPMQSGKTTALQFIAHSLNDFCLKHESGKVLVLCSRQNAHVFENLSRTDVQTFRSAQPIDLTQYRSIILDTSGVLIPPCSLMVSEGLGAQVEAMLRELCQLEEEGRYIPYIYMAGFHIGNVSNPMQDAQNRKNREAQA